MADGAAHLVDKVIPNVPMRQYVLSLPFETRGVLGFRPKLMNAVQKAFIDCVQKWHGERAKEYGFVDGKCGGLVVLHRFNGSLGLQPHLHALLTDGVYTPDAVFHPFHAPDEAHLATLVERIATRVRKILVRAGVASDENDPLAACSREALQAGNRSRGDDDPPPVPSRGKKLAVELNGFNLEATTLIAGNDRKSLEHMCRYLLRGPLALERLHINDDGNAEYELKRPDRHGHTTLTLTPHQLIARLTALIPAPHLCLRRTFGVLAPRSPVRQKIVPNGARPHRHTAADEKPAAQPTRTPWAELLDRVYGVAPLRCGKCGGHMVEIACVRSKTEARRYLEGTGQYVELPAQGRSRKKPP
jgi:hypothetical protein